jgi:hypothetical protein
VKCSVNGRKLKEPNIPADAAQAATLTLPFPLGPIGF